MLSNANSQIFGLHAVGQILADGSGAIAFGCQLVRVGVGAYELRLPEDKGLIPNESFITVTPRFVDEIPMSPPGQPVVVDNDEFVKQIFMKDGNNNPIDQGFTIMVDRSTLPSILMV